MNCKRLSAILIPSILTLSACQQVMAMDHLPQEAVAIVQEVESYHQVVTLQNTIETHHQNGESKKEENYSITEATLFPEDSLAYGTRINKKTDAEPLKISISRSESGTFQQKNNGHWLASATAEPLMTALEVMPYPTFVELTQIFADKGRVYETNGEIKIVFSGSDAEINQKISTLLDEFPVPQTVYKMAATLNKTDHRLIAFSLVVEENRMDGREQHSKQINSIFSKYNQQSIEQGRKNAEEFRLSQAGTNALENE